MTSSTQIIDASTMVGAHPTHKLDMSVERLIREMDKHRITAGLTISAVGIFHSFSEGNDLTLEAAKANKRLVPIATANPKSYYGTAADMQALRGKGFRVFKFYPNDQDWPIGSAAFGEILKQLAPLKMPVMINAGRPGAPGEVGRMVSGYPAPVILCAVSMDAFSEALAVMAELPNVMLETHELHATGALKLAADRIGADRIVFGSGAPRRSIASSLHYILNSELSGEDKQRILGGNIRRILEAA